MLSAALHRLEPPPSRDRSVEIHLYDKANREPVKPKRAENHTARFSSSAHPRSAMRRLVGYQRLAFVDSMT
jgi:hypothetical protein